MSYRGVRGFLYLAVLAVVPLQGETPVTFRGSGGWCYGERYDQHFSTERQELFFGNVENIDTVTPYPGMALGIKLDLRTENDELLTVHLGPAWYILYQNWDLEADERYVGVKGCRTSINGKMVIMATLVGNAPEGEVADGDQALWEHGEVQRLRDEDGIPYWCAWRPRLE